MKLLTALFRMARKRVQTTDNDMGMFRDKLSELVTNCSNLKDEEVSEKVEELKGIMADLPDSEDKSKLERFLEDFKSVKEQDAATAKEAADMVSDLFEKLDTDAMKEMPSVETEEQTEEVEQTDGETGTEEEVEEKSETETKDADETAEETVEETVAPDSDANRDYTLEEIWQFIKKRMAEDSECKDGAEEVEEDKEEEEEEVVTDHAPHIPVTMNCTGANGTLSEMFAKIKEGGR